MSGYLGSSRWRPLSSFWWVMSITCRQWRRHPTICLVGYSNSRCCALKEVGKDDGDDEGYVGVFDWGMGEDIFDKNI